VGWVWASVLRRCLGCTCALQAVAEAERDVSANFAEQLRAAGVTVPVVGVGTPAVAATSNGYAAAAAVPLPSPRWEIIALEIIGHPGFAASSHDEIVDARTQAAHRPAATRRPTWRGWTSCTPATTSSVRAVAAFGSQLCRAGLYQ
jgi:hypothetical protein